MILRRLYLKSIEWFSGMGRAEEASDGYGSPWGLTHRLKGQVRGHGTRTCSKLWPVPWAERMLGE